ncbi:MAG: hypothetical protein ACI8UO_003724 [Verrucomicrobiales bacterium]|jgi:hypothetical protein
MARSIFPNSLNKSCRAGCGFVEIPVVMNSNSNHIPVTRAVQIPLIFAVAILVLSCSSRSHAEELSRAEQGLLIKLNQQALEQLESIAAKMEENETGFLYFIPESGLVLTGEELHSNLTQLLPHARLKLTQEEIEIIAASRVRHWEYRVYREEIDAKIKDFHLELQRLRLEISAT